MAISRAKAVFYGATGAFLVLVAAALVYPEYEDFRSRAIASEVLLQARSIQDEVEVVAGKQGTLAGAGASIHVTPMKLGNRVIAEGEVLSGGEIVLRGKPYGQVIVLIPAMSGDRKITWRCIAGSTNDVTQTCRAE
jgi:hypothetical protein